MNAPKDFPYPPQKLAMFLAAIRSVHPITSEEERALMEQLAEPNAVYFLDITVNAAQSPEVIARLEAAVRPIADEGIYVSVVATHNDPGALRICLENLVGTEL